MIKKSGIIILVLSSPLLILMIIEAMIGISLSGNAFQSVDEIKVEDNLLFVEWQDNRIELKEIDSGAVPYSTPWEDKVQLRKIELWVNEVQQAELAAVPIRINETDGNRIHGEIGLATTNDSFVVLARTTTRVVIENEEKQIIGEPSDDDLSYEMYTIDQTGHVEKSQFTFNDRTFKQTQLLNTTYMYPHALGYLTNAFIGYPNFIYPVFYPFATAFIGLFLWIGGNWLNRRSTDNV